jgi:hypothetical protein
MFALVSLVSIYAPPTSIEKISLDKKLKKK